MKPIAIPCHITKHYQPTAVLEKRIPEIRENFARLLKGQPDISVVIPAYNEETTILKTLSSLSDSKTSFSVEVIVVNNNSTDATEQLVNATQVRCIYERKQGIAAARNAGLAVARGKYIVNADADTIYPPDWIEEMVKPLVEKEDIALTYGGFSFIPISDTPRLTYFFYEYFADFTRALNKKYREEAANVYGFNSAFRREQGLNVDGFNFPPGAGEDGWLALKLRQAGYGKLYRVSKSNAIVWTTDRRIQIDGGLWKGTVKRLKRVVS